MSVAHLRGFKRIYNHYTANKKASAKKTDAFSFLSSIPDHRKLIKQFFLGLIASAKSAHAISASIHTSCSTHAAIIAIASAVHAATVSRHIVIVAA